MERTPMDSELLGPEILELSVPYPNKSWLIRKFLWQICFSAIIVFLMVLFDGHTIDLTLLRDWFCATVLLVIITILLRFWPFGCLRKVVFFQNAFVVYRKPILYRVVRDVFYIQKLEIIDRRRDKHYIEFRNSRGYIQVISFKDGWTDEQLDQIIKQLEQYEGVTFIHDKKHFRYL